MQHKPTPIHDEILTMLREIGTDRVAIPDEPTPDPLPTLIRGAIESHDPRKIIALAPLIARTDEVRQAGILTEIYNGFGKELNRPIFMQAVRAERKKAAREDRERTYRDDWTANLLTKSNGSPQPVLANAITALEQCPEWAGVLAFNEFTLTTVIQRATPLDVPFTAGQPWTDQHDRLATEWLQSKHIAVGVDVASQAVQTVAMKTVFHPVRDYLSSLEWDGEQRIDRWVFRYLGVPQDDVREYSAAVGRRFLISAVARIFRPGCKADCAVILEGAQGIKKSTALKTLAGDWFTDEIADFGSKDAAMQMQGAWIIELGELDNLKRKETSIIKAFMSRTVDRFRPPYGRHVISAARQCVFAGSVNEKHYLQDDTGNRRFWPLRCGGPLHIEALARDRDQLWAEAVTAFQDGSVWWLDTPELNALASQEQEHRRTKDPWEQVIADWVETNLSTRITVSQVLEKAVNKRVDTWTRADQMRVAACLVNLGFEKRRDGTGDRQWFYEVSE